MGGGGGGGARGKTGDGGGTRGVSTGVFFRKNAFDLFAFIVDPSQ